VKLKCFSMVEKGSPVGCPAFPIGQGKDPGYTRERKRERKKRKTKKGRAQGLRCPSPLWAGPASPTDDNEGVRMLRLCLSPALQAGVAVLVMIPRLSLVLQAGAAAWSRRLVPSWHAVWSTDPFVWSRTGIE
jgi:hypothetical protein